MAEVLESFEFDPIGRKPFPWDDWFDGRIWKLTQGVDFKNSTKNFRDYAYLQARHRGGSVVISVIDDAALVLKFTPNG